LNEKADNLIDVYFGSILKRGVNPSDKSYEPCFDQIKLTDVITYVMKEEFKP